MVPVIDVEGEWDHFAAQVRVALDLTDQLIGWRATRSALRREQLDDDGLITHRRRFRLRDE